MKAFITSIITLLVIASAVTINCTIVTKVCDDMLAAAEELPLTPSGETDAVKRIDEIFSKKEKYLTLSINHSEVDTIKDLIAEIAIKQEPGDYACAVEKFKIKISELKESESFSLKRIL